MRKTLLTLLCALALPIAAHAQKSWTYAGLFPPDTLKTNDTHGLAVDPDGKVWIQDYYGSQSFTFADTVVIGTTKYKTLNVRAIYVYNPDGTPATFSPIITLKQNGAVADTLGLQYLGTAVVGGNTYKSYDTMTGRGLRASPADGNIYVSQGDRLIRLNYQTGEMMNATTPYPGASLTAAAVDGAGNVYTRPVVAGDGSPIKRFSADLVELDPALITGTKGFSRSFEVSRDGNTIYWAGYTTHAIHMYRRNDEFSSFPTVPDTVLQGMDSESVTIHPVTNDLWVAAGSPNDAPNRFPGFESHYQMQTWYAFDQQQISGNYSNPPALDSIKWNGGGTGRPRALAFSPSGMVAYAGQFGQAGPSVQKFLFTEGSAVEGRNTLPDGFAVLGTYPNPTSGLTTLSFSLPQAGPAALKVYDTLGREVATVVDDVLAADTYDVSFDASGLPAGLYLYRLQSGGRLASGTFTVVR